MINPDPGRWAIAASMVLAYAGLCTAIWRSRRTVPVATGSADWLVVHASQTGTGEFLAARTRETLATGGLNAHVTSMEALTEAQLRQAQRVLFIVSTYGEGDPPDSGARFARMIGATSTDLGHLHYGVLALGDSTYTHYCGFGRRVDAALAERGAQALFERVEADRVAPAAIEAWQHHLSHLAGTSDAPDWSAPAYADWRIAERTLLNAGSAGAPVYLIALEPQEGVLPRWEAGDLVQVSAPADPDYPREYSIASLPSDGRLELVVRLHVRDDGSYGAASGWLCAEASMDAQVKLRLREHRRFQAGENDVRPMILIGNGTGIAGLRSHIKSRPQKRTWLLFGERSAAHDALFAGELAQWQRSGVLERLDLAYSRDGGAHKYVQHLLAERATLLRAWIDDGAAIYVCGSLQGMAGGVHDVLTEVLGKDALDQLDAQGRYRRDVY